ncbi:MAG: hypothetical protein L0I83_09545, partial [Enterobacterales bacterium]|nr:hypothetical protein [Enterobacterales bacterium]
MACKPERQPEGAGTVNNSAHNLAKNASMQSLLESRYVMCPDCRQRIRGQLYSMLNQCQTWCPRCK